jgi:hypothetical protein
MPHACLTLAPSFDNRQPSTSNELAGVSGAAGIVAIKQSASQGKRPAHERPSLSHIGRRDGRPRVLHVAISLSGAYHSARKAFSAATTGEHTGRVEGVFN